MKHEKLAREMYDTYCKAVGGTAYNGDKLPTSEEFFTDPMKEKQADAWREAAKKPWEMLLRTTQNLAHPAYGHSSATTIGIDELREEAFDYLGIPK